MFRILDCFHLAGAGALFAIRQQTSLNEVKRRYFLAPVEQQ